MTDNGNHQQVLQDWRAELDAALAAQEEADRRAAEVERQEAIARRNRYIEQVMDLAAWLGIEGELLERKPSPDEDERSMPVIVRDGYGFLFVPVRFETREQRRRLNPDGPRDVSYVEDEHEIAYFNLEVRRVAVEEGECRLKKCVHDHGVRRSMISTPGMFTEKNSVLVNRTTGEGRDEFRVKLAALLREVDRAVIACRRKHAEYIEEVVRAAESVAYAEKEHREYVPPPEPEIPDEPEEVEEPITLPEPPKPRQRIVYEGTFEWRLLQLFDEVRGYGYWE